MGWKIVNNILVYVWPHLRARKIWRWRTWIQYLFNKLNTGSQVHTEVDELPLNTFFLVFFLLEDEHVVVEELLESLVGVVDTQLLEAVEL